LTFTAIKPQLLGIITMITATFTDPQGQKWVDAKLRAINFNVNCNSSMSVNHNDLDSPQGRTNMNASGNMQVIYWPNQEAIDAGHTPYSLDKPADDMGDKQFRVTFDMMPVDAAALEAACETHLVDVILPPMQG